MAYGRFQQRVFSFFLIPPSIGYCVRELFPTVSVNSVFSSTILGILHFFRRTLLRRLAITKSLM